MTLEEAIVHCKENICDSSLCSCQHQQLYDWLQELKRVKDLDVNELVDRMGYIIKEYDQGIYASMTPLQMYRQGIIDVISLVK